MNGLHLQTVACDLCGASGSSAVTDTRDHEHGVDGVFNVVRCVECGLHYLNPRPTPDAIGRCYPGDYYAFAGGAVAPVSASLKGRLKRLIRRHRPLSAFAGMIGPLRHLATDAAITDDIPGWVKPGTVLDVGCGSGGFLDAMRESGWTTVGIEPGEKAASLARAKGHDVVCQSATDPLAHALSGRLFDLVLMSHSLEHVHSPTQALANLWPLLKPGTGHLIIEVPNLESLLTYWFGELGLAFDTPRHLYMFSPDTLSKLLAKTGFEVCSIRHVARPMQFVRCLRLLSQARTPQNWVTAAEASLTGNDILKAFQPLARLAMDKGLGGAIRVVAIRR